MSAHIDETYIENAIGASVQTSLATGSALTQAITSASAVVDAALMKAGYTPPTSSPAELVKLATLGQALVLLYGGRAGYEIPVHLAATVEFASRIASGDMPVPGMTTEAKYAVGGVRFSDSDADSTDATALPQKYGTLRTVF